MDKMTRKEAFSLAVDAYYKKSSVAEYSAEDREEGLRNYLADLNKDYRNNKNEIFQIIEDTVNEILPKKVLDLVRDFAEFQTFNDNVTVKFKAKNGKIKATWVAIGGTVERNRVDKGSFTVKTEAVQCKVYEEYERVIGGLVDWTSLINEVVNAIMEAIMRKVYQTLIGVYSKLPAVNAHTTPAFDGAEFTKVANVIKAYGNPVIMGTPLAVAQIPLDTYASEADKMDIRNKGFLGMYKGMSVVELPQSFEDETNLVKVFDDQYLFIIPAGAEKIVKVALEGGLKTRESNGQDWTVNFEAYQKVGVSTFAVNNIGMYKMTNLA
jgi:hypothetical protein